MAGKHITCLQALRDIIHDPERYRGIFEIFYEEER